MICQPKTIQINITVDNLLSGLVIRQTFFAKSSKKLKSPIFSSAKLSCYMCFVIITFNRKRLLDHWWNIFQPKMTRHHKWWSKYAIFYYLILIKIQTWHIYICTKLILAITSIAWEKTYTLKEQCTSIEPVQYHALFHCL